MLGIRCIFTSPLILKKTKADEQPSESTANHFKFFRFQVWPAYLCNGFCSNIDLYPPGYIHGQKI